MASNDVSEANHFYRENYQTIIIILIVAIFLMLLAVNIVLYQVFHRPLPQFGAVAANGQRMELVAQEEPNLQANTLLKWASKAAVQAYTFDFVNFDKQAALSRPNFTDAGWMSYQSSVANLIQQIVQRKLFVNSVVVGTPVIANQGDLPGRGYVWRIQMPFLVTYQSAETTSQQRFTVILTIAKISTSINPTGIGIDQFLMVQ